MVKKYQIYADEAWTHQVPPNRYHTFFGGIFGTESDIDRLSQDLNKIKKASKFPKHEVKWSSLSKFNYDYFIQLIDCIFTHIESGKIKYRQMFLDRSYHYVGDASSSDLDVQYKLYYQFLKHMFGLQHLPHEESEILLRLDGHSSQKHKDDLKDFVENNVPNKISRNDISINVTYIDSKRHINLQVCDVLMGAAGYYGNKYFDRKESGAKRMTAKQSLKKRLAKYIYNKLRDINNADRGAKAFNWFESTGLSDDERNNLHHKIRIWKFTPREYVINAGWHNDHLDKQGRFIADDFRQL